MGDLTELDDVLAELAGVLHRASPLPHWERQQLDVRHSPDGGVASHDYLYELADDSVDQSVSPEAPARQAIRELTERHWQLSRGADGQSWFRMTVSVDRDGHFSAEFEYRSDDRPGDVARRA